ncbi:hypothetical protein OSB04_029423 [Centaurea solstitialis]|uniref:BHLH domain-containing protein n=1 Tax=Centaurea solstitialis TaxID=347529 RepID=A0AA38VYS6_9ASTR|nr:hypothetical protein OSB04_029423 [Centaurea solstitialis]
MSRMRWVLLILGGKMDPERKRSGGLRAKQAGRGSCREALKTLCGVNQWSYAIFWKIGCQNPKLLIWEECYYEPVIYANANSGHGVEARNKVHTLVNKMMKDNYINLLGEGLVGRVAFTRIHQWIISDNKMLGVHPPEVSNEVYTQFSAGIHTIAVIPVHPHGVVQLGSSSTIMENMGFVNDVKSLISQLGCVPGALLSENYVSFDHRDYSVSTHSSGKSKLNLDGCNHSPQASGTSNQVARGSTLASPPIIFPKSDAQANLFVQDQKNDHQTAFGLLSADYDSLRSMEQRILSDSFLGDLQNDTMMARKSNDIVQAQLAATSNPHSLPDARFSFTHVDKQLKPTSDKEKLENELFQALTMSSEEACLKAPSRDDLFDIVGMDFTNKLFGGKNHNNFSGVPLNLTKNDSAGLEFQSSDFFSVYEGESDSGVYSSTASDHLLDAVVSKAQSKTNEAPPVVWANQGVRLKKMSYKSGISNEDVGNFSDSSSIISSQISSHDVRKNSSGVASEYGKRADETSKSTRKRLKPGENPRPRPKDRQMIQDRVKELREIIPNGAKCSIDALLERTIKHMVFLQSVTKHADKLKQTGESKIVSKDGGLLLRDNFEGGATWAYEVDSQSMVCPIIVEDLNSPRQMLVELCVVGWQMLCEERGSFLEIADVIKGLGLTILKGVMESRNDKIWAHFTVEANRDVTRMEIFISLVSLLEQAPLTSTGTGADLVNI